MNPFLFFLKQKSILWRFGLYDALISTLYSSDLYGIQSVQALFILIKSRKANFMLIFQLRNDTLSTTVYSGANSNSIFRTQNPW